MTINILLYIALYNKIHFYEVINKVCYYISSCITETNILLYVFLCNDK